MRLTETSQNGDVTTVRKEETLDFGVLSPEELEKLQADHMLEESQ